MVSYYSPREQCFRQALCLILVVITGTSISCDKERLRKAKTATERLSADISEAKRTTLRLSQASLITEAERNSVEKTLSLTDQSVTILQKGLIEATARNEKPTKETFTKLSTMFGDVSDGVETFNVTVSTLENPTAREHYQPILDVIDSDLDAFAEIMKCERIDENCVRCPDNQVYCRKHP